MKNKSKVQNHYPTLKPKELMALPINEMLEDNALVFMWVSSPFLEKAIRIGKAWKLKYATIGFVWDKIKSVPGNYTMSQIEICLIFKKGNIPKPRGARNIEQFYCKMKREHSRKPEEIRTRIEKMFPTQSKLEMFARTQYEGWDSWGNEVDKFKPNIRLF